MREIVVETDSEQYTGGELVAGKCIVRLDEPLPVRGVRVRWQGYERSHWSEGSGKSRHTHGQTHYFFNEERTVFGKPPLGAGELIADALKGLFSREGYETLAAGEHAFDFSFVLPIDLPPDFDSETSSCIAYEITAHVDIPLRMDLSATRRLGMRGSRPAPAPRPVTRSNSKTFLTGGSGQMSLQAALERDVFRPGERLRGVAEVINESGKEIQGVDIVLQRIMHLSAGSASASRCLDAGSAKVGALETSPGRPVRFVMDFDLPGDLYPSIESTGLVRVTYQLNVSLDVPWAIDLAVSLPVTIAEPEPEAPPVPVPDADPLAAFPQPPEETVEPLLDAQTAAMLDDDDLRALRDFGRRKSADDGTDEVLDPPPENGDS